MAGLFVNRDSFALGGTGSSSTSQIGARADWAPGSAGFFRPVRDTGDAIAVNDSINRIAAALLAKPGPVVSDAVNSIFVPVAQLAFDRWPVSTGLSKSQLFLEITTTGGSLTVTLANRAPYAAGIHDGATVRELIFGPGTEAAGDMASAIGKGLAR